MNTLKLVALFLFSSFLISCSGLEKPLDTDSNTRFTILVAGIAQDAGYPQANCHKECCIDIWADGTKRKLVSCLALLDHQTKEYWVFDATPDFKDQIKLIQDALGTKNLPSGIFLTHAHIGHYTGLMHLGREVIGSNAVPVYAMPKMTSFLKNNGPWSQLVALNNISLIQMTNDSTIHLKDELAVKPVQVPHRDEYSETVGFEIEGESKKVLFIPDINKWEIWDKSINEYIENVDLAFLDGSFYKNGEIPGRDMSEIPHPFIEESMSIFHKLSNEDKTKVHFIHFNHTNPVLRENSPEYNETIKAGYNISRQGDIFDI